MPSMASRPTSLALLSPQAATQPATAPARPTAATPICTWAAPAVEILFALVVVDVVLAGGLNNPLQREVVAPAPPLAAPLPVVVMAGNPVVTGLPVSAPVA